MRDISLNSKKLSLESHWKATTANILLSLLNLKLSPVVVSFLLLNLLITRH